MNREYIKYRPFLRQFASQIQQMKPDTLYEIVGGHGETKGFFSLTDPYAQNKEGV